MWSARIGIAGGNNTGACLPSPAVDYQLKRLFVAGNQTTIGGVDYQGGLRALDPGTGAVAWERGLPCLPNGSPTLNGAIVAVPMYACPAGVTPSVQLYRETDGTLLATIPASDRLFAQPVFAHGELFVAAEDGTLTAYAP